MSKTIYLIQAWCARPFIAHTEVAADTPGQALDLAQAGPDKLLDSAEECNGDYPWDEFAVYDEFGNELLHHAHADARARNAGPELLEALEYLLRALGRLPITVLDGPAYVALNKARAAVTLAKGTAA